MPIAIKPRKQFYQPLILRFGSLDWINPIFLFLLLAALLCSITWYFEGPLLTPMNLAYLVAFSNYLKTSHQNSLLRLQPVLTLTEQEFDYWYYRLGHYHKAHMLSIVLLAVPAMFFVNWSHPEVQMFLQGQLPGLGFFWGLLLAIVNWVVILQVGYIVISNTLGFAELARDHTRIDIFNIREQIPFTRVGISSMLLFAGAYTMIPIAYVDSGTLVLPALISLVITLPMALTLFILPLAAIRGQVYDEKMREVDLVSSAINGDRAALKQTLIADESEEVSKSTLIIYRDLVERANEWPITESNLQSLALYIIIPLLAWVGAALVERLIDTIL